jgi:hypothetical protein
MNESKITYAELELSFQEDHRKFIQWMFEELEYVLTDDIVKQIVEQIDNNNLLERLPKS